MAVNFPEHDPGDLITGVMLQITQHAERLALLDQREATHFREIADRLADQARLLTETSDRVNNVNDLAARQAALLETLDSLDQQVAALTARLTTMASTRASDDESYQPVPAPQWWKLNGTTATGPHSGHCSTAANAGCTGAPKALGTAPSWSPPCAACTTPASS